MVSWLRALWWAQRGQKNVLELISLGRKGSAYGRRGILIDLLALSPTVGYNEYNDERAWL